MENNISPWQERFTWFWFCEDEILRYTEDDFKRRAKELHDRGITVAINFSLTHFRMSYYKYWDVINASFRKFVDACHEYGIKVIEHHSSSLVHNLLSQAGWGRFEADLGSYSNWTATVDTWIEVPRYLVCDPKIDGKRLEDMFQIDGRTGKISDTVYHCHAFCYNNPDYRAMYFKYMKDLLAEVPFDGMMNDDVQYFGAGNACTCKHCRKKFKEQYGYDLPQPEDWDAFYGDYNNPAYIAWERFKRDSTEQFYRDLTKLYEELGVKLLRPNYCSDILMYNITSYGFDRCCDIWDFIFQENCFSAIIKCSYMNFMAESIHRFAAGAQHGVPSMSMFYPDRADSVYFSWALAKTWGQLYTGTSEGVDITGFEKKYRDFEQENIRALSAPKKLEDVAFYLSLQTRDYTKDAPQQYMIPFIGSLQASCLAGLGVNMAFETDTVEMLQKHPILVASHTALVSDDELERFLEYVKHGGKLVIYGDFAEFDAESKPRDIKTVLKALGFSANAKKLGKTGNVSVSLGNNRIVMEDMKALYVFDGEETLATLEDGTCVGIHKSIGDGEILWLAAKMQKSEMQDSIWANRRQPVPPRVEAQPSLREHQLSHTGAFLNLAVGERHLKVTCEQDELLANAYIIEDGVAIHIVNLADTIPTESCMVGHEDIISNFAEGAKKLPSMKIQLLTKEPVHKAVLRTPEQNVQYEIPFAKQDEKIILDVPADLFAGYALILLEK